MPFELCKVPKTFQKIMKKDFSKEINSFIFVYLDDILIFSHSIREHWDHLQTALDRLRRAKLYDRLHRFLKERVDYLGFEVSKDGIHTSPRKVKAILNWPQPQSVHCIRSFGEWIATIENFLSDFATGKASERPDLG